MSRLLTTCAAIGLLVSVAGLEKVDAKGGPFSLHGPWANASAQNNATDSAAPTGYEAKSFCTPPGSGHQRRHRL